MSLARQIESKLREALNPLTLVVTDESALHAGHAGARPGGETHFRVEIVSQAFVGLSRLARQRLVFEAVREEMDRGLHALSIAARAPDE